MDDELADLADTIHRREYEELFPDTTVDEVKNDEEKVKEALFQVHHIVYSKQLYDKISHPAHNDYYIPMTEIAESLDSEEDFVRFKKRLKGATLKQEGDEVMIPKPDVKDILSFRRELRD